jgi:hypothetical protein
MIGKVSNDVKESKAITAESDKSCENKQFACPFYKKDPRKFSICKKEGFQDMKGVMDHVREVHGINVAPALQER